MWLIVLMIVAASVSAILLTMTLINLWVLGRPGVAVTGDPRLVSICIPARNEAPNIEACVKGLLASNHPNVEVLVYDDQSTDATSTILRSLCDIDPRVRTTPTLPLPEGWNGKQHACWRLAAAAKGDWLLFTDADVRFEPDAVGTALSEADRLQADLISGFPRQITRTFAESLIVPMIFFVLFSYLPFPRMRLSNDPAASAGCGQFLFVSRRGYDACGGHAGFKDSMHDGIRMPSCRAAVGPRRYHGRDFLPDVFGFGVNVAGLRQERIRGVGLSLLAPISFHHPPVGTGAALDGVGMVRVCRV